LFNAKNRDELINIIKSSSFTLDIPGAPANNPDCQYIIKARQEIEGELATIDFFLYDDEGGKKDCILQRWVPGYPDGGSRCRDGQGVSFPREMLFPITSGQIQNVPVKIPNDPEACCRFVYGEDWRTPLEHRLSARIVTKRMRKQCDLGPLFSGIRRDIYPANRKIRSQFWNMGAREFVLSEIKNNGGSRIAVARMMGLSASEFLKFLKKLDITRRDIDKFLGLI